MSNMNLKDNDPRTEIQVALAYTDEDNSFPSMANVGDILKEFQSVFNIAASMEYNLGRTSLRVKRVSEGSIVVTVLADIVKEALVTICQKVSRLWGYHGLYKEREFLTELNLPDLFNGSLIKKSPSKQQLKQYTQDEDIIARAIVAEHISRARNWKITIVEVFRSE